MPKYVIKKAVDCTRCGLCEQRTQVVFGQGNLDTGIMVIGEAPGKYEDQKGRPFVGRSGKLLDAWLELAGLTRDDVFATNVVLCRPPGNRNPEPEEIERCKKWLTKVFKRIQPWLIITVGSFASKAILNNDKFAVTNEGGVLHPVMLDHLGYHTSDYVLVYPIVHPAYTMRDPDAEMAVLDHMEWLGKKVLTKAPESRFAL